MQVTASNRLSSHWMYIPFLTFDIIFAIFLCLHHFSFVITVLFRLVVVAHENFLVARQLEPTIHESFNDPIKPRSTFNGLLKSKEKPIFIK